MPLNQAIRKGSVQAPGPLFAGLLLLALSVSACKEPAQPQASVIAGDPVLCTKRATAITQIQGDDYYSPLEGSQQTVAGIVTAIERDEGFYLEESEGAAPGKSRALFVATPTLSANARAGQRWVVTGTVEELGERRDKMTSLAELRAFAVCGDGLPLPLTPALLPLSSKQREALEGMRIAIGQDLVISDVYSHYRDEVSLSAGSTLRAPTEDERPGNLADQIARGNRERTIDVRLPEAPPAPLAVGSRAPGVTGVLGHDGRDAVLLADSADSEPLPPPGTFPAAEAGQLRVASANLLNFFNGDGRGGGFPAERGPRSAEEFHDQKNRTRAVMERLRPDLLAVQELENDGVGPHSAAADLLRLLDSIGAGDFAQVEPNGGYLGNDVITVGLFYRPAALEPVGPPHTLTAEPFRERSRQPLAQVFREKASGETFLVAVNHLKSKGSCPDDGPNRNHDGQGCWNRVRVESVEALLPWLNGLAGQLGTEKILVVGDMNAYRREDPIERFRAGGYTELVEALSGLPQYSVRFYGQGGTLDYALASPALSALAARAGIWHINADWPPRMELQQPWLRMSDHDPVVVDLDFSRPR